jgi:hypothetical protein
MEVQSGKGSSAGWGRLKSGIGWISVIIYLSDARKVAPEKLKTVIRHPIKVKG